jgi:hypothetical protein
MTVRIEVAKCGASAGSIGLILLVLGAMAALKDAYPSESG